MQPWLGAFLFILIGGCAARHTTAVPYTVGSEDLKAPHYNDLYFWAAHPWKKDPSDSIPADLRNETIDSIADVFFIHPTTYTQSGRYGNASVYDEVLNAKTDFSSILYQASVFNQHCRVFAPRYRQAHYSSFFVDAAASKYIFDTAYADVRRAFLYYIKNDHHNRPLIIAGHSQGALLAERLLQEFFDGQPLAKKLVAAYLIGWPIPRNLFSSLPVCATPEQTGCFCGWRTFKKGYMPAYIPKETTVSFVTNPLNWTTSEAYAGRKLNKGSVLKNFNKLVPATTDAQIHGGVLWVAKPRFPGSIFFTTPNYHIVDINLFYANLRENVAQRIKAYVQER